MEACAQCWDKNKVIIFVYCMLANCKLVLSQCTKKLDYENKVKYDRV